MDAAFLNCGHCGNFAEMKTLGSAPDTKEVNDDTGAYSYGKMYEVLKCPSCGKINFASYSWSDIMEAEDFNGYTLIYPVQKVIPIGLPKIIEQEYEAAEKIKLISPSAYALLLGRILEMICHDRNASGKTLHEKLSDLKEKGEIPEKLVKVAASLRGYRNIGAHYGLGEISEAEIGIVRALCNALLEFVYSAPHLADIAEKQLQSIKKVK